MQNNRLFKSKKGFNTFTLTIAFLLVNVLLLMMIRAYSLDPDMVDELQNQGLVSVNASLQEGEFSYSSVSWLDSFRITFSSLPWWMSMLFIIFEGAMTTLIVYAWIRGMS